MNRTWLAGLAAALVAAQMASCTTQQDLGDRPDEGDSGLPDANGNNGDAPGPPRPMRAFVTKSLFTGNLQASAKRNSGLEAGDAICQLAADGATLGGHWAAWLSDQNMDAIDRIDNDGPWVSFARDYTQGRKVFLDRAGIGAGPIEDDTLSTEYGERCVGCDFGYRSGTSATGRATGNDCASWSSSSAGGGECGSARLLCLEQKLAAYRKRVFVTSKEFNITQMGGSPNYERAEALCADAAKAANLGGRWRAWLSYSKRSTVRAHDRLGSRVSSWTLVDGATVAISSRDQLLSGPEHAIDRDEFNQAVPATSYVWTGTTAKGETAVDNCYDFSVNQGTTYQATVGAVGSTSGTWTEAAKVTCDKSARLYCFEL